MSWTGRLVQAYRVLDRYLQTVRYLRPRQWIWRPYLRARRLMYGRFPSLRTALAREAVAAAQGLGFRRPGPFLEPIHLEATDWQAHLSVAERTTRLEFCFLNESAAFSGRIDWASPSRSQLWRYNLHYQAYLLPLGIVHRLTGRPEFYTAFKDVVEGWIAANQAPFGDGWHPYVVSLRVVNWLSAAHLFSDALGHDPEFQDRFRASLIEGIIFISRNLERDVGGNHFLENVKALCLAGSFFSGAAADGWLNLGLRLLHQELGRQVLPDGGHYERSPMYHCIVLEDLLIVAAALRNSGIPWPEGLKDALVRMVRFLGGTVHPDGRIALFNDSVFGIAPEPRSLFSLARGLLGTGCVPTGATAQLDARYAWLVAGADAGPGGPVAGEMPEAVAMRSVREIVCPDSGYFGVRDNDSFFLFDAGPACPDDLPAHAHADIFSYELSIGGQRWVVDSGVREYRPGEWRDYARSTRAHNTVSVSGLNQVDVWSSFRVGRRVRPAYVSIFEDHGIVVMTGRHYGFGRARPHTRIVAVQDGRTWVFIDEVGGFGLVRVENFMHFHPEVVVEANQSGAVLSRKGASDTQVRLVVAGAERVSRLAGQVQPLNGWYMPEFGTALPNPTVIIETDRLPSLTAYVLTVGDEPVDLSVEAVGNRRRCSWHSGGEESNIEWDAVELKPLVGKRT